MESFATPYPLMYQDDDGGEPRACGFVGVHSVLTYKRFQALINDVEKRQKLPVNDSTNFSIILNQHPPSKERDAHFLVALKKSKKDRKGGVGGAKKKTDADEDEDDDSELGASPPDKASSALRTGLPAPPMSAAAAAAAQREAVQQERERLNMALGRATSAPEAKTALPSSEARALAAAKAAAAAPGTRPVASGVATAAAHGAAASAAAAAAASARAAVPAPLLAGARAASGPAYGAAAKAGASAALAESGASRATAPLPPRSSDGMGDAASRGALCKFCAFCRDRVHAPPFHWCCDDRVVPAQRGPTPFGPVSPLPDMGRMGAVGA